MSGAAQQEVNISSNEGSDLNPQPVASSILTEVNTVTVPGMEHTAVDTSSQIFPHVDLSAVQAESNVQMEHAVDAYIGLRTGFMDELKNAGISEKKISEFTSLTDSIARGEKEGWDWVQAQVASSHVNTQEHKKDSLSAEEEAALQQVTDFLKQHGVNPNEGLAIPLLALSLTQVPEFWKSLESGGKKLFKDKRVLWTAASILLISCVVGGVALDAGKTPESPPPTPSVALTAVADKPGVQDWSHLTLTEKSGTQVTIGTERTPVGSEIVAARLIDGKFTEDQNGVPVDKLSSYFQFVKMPLMQDGKEVGTILVMQTLDAEGNPVNEFLVVPNTSGQYSVMTHDKQDTGSKIVIQGKAMVLESPVTTNNTTEVRSYGLKPVDPKTGKIIDTTQSPDQLLTSFVEMLTVQSVAYAQGEPTAVSSPTTAPTEAPTVDPNIPKAPDGVTLQKDAQGYYFDQDRVRYRDTTLTDSLGQERLRGWFSNHVTGGDLLDGGITIMPQNQYFSAGIPMYFYSQFGVPLPYISHTPSPADGGKDLTSAIYNGLYDQRFSNISRLQMLQDYQNGNIKVSFTTPDGKTYVWTPGPEVNNKNAVGIEFYNIPLQDGDPATHPEFFQTPEDKQFGTAVYRWTVFTKSDGTLVILSAVQDSGALNDTENAERFVNPIGVVIEHEKLSAADLNKGWALGGYPSDYVAGVIPKWRGLSRPYFDFKANP